jgi:alanine racemase
MTIRTQLVLVKRVPAGAGVSYGHRYVTSRETTLGLVPLGYAEGIPRQAGNTAQVQVRGRRWTISGTVCMNQVVVDFGDTPVAPGDEVVLRRTGRTRSARSPMTSRPGSRAGCPEATLE